MWSASLVAIVLVFLARLSVANNNEFKYPPPDGSNAQFVIGDVQTIRWNTTYSHYNISLWQNIGGHVDDGVAIQQVYNSTFPLQRIRSLLGFDTSIRYIRGWHGDANIRLDGANVRRIHVHVQGLLLPSRSRPRLEMEFRIALLRRQQRRVSDGLSKAVKKHLHVRRPNGRRRIICLHRFDLRLEQHGHEGRARSRSRGRDSACPHRRSLGRHEGG
ncbi:hypothetical protein BKA81DRAFT_402069 [Phyllosticta paracitricarpa]